MSSSSQFALLSQRRFAPFFWTQFLGALNDNVFKIALLTALTYDTARWTTLDTKMLNNLIPGLFILPFVLFSATAGQLADKLEKAGLARAIKLAEIAIMLVAAYGWYVQELWLLVAAIVGMGLHSTFFGPVKYAYLPQQLKPTELVGGNGLVEMGTFIGILLGEILGAVLVLQQPWGMQAVAGTTLIIALLGWLSSRLMLPVPVADPTLVFNWNPLSETLRNLRFARKQPAVFAAMLANSWFWFFGAILLAQFPVYAKDYLKGDQGIFVLLLTAFSLGIGVGSLACERLSGRKPESGLVVLGLIGLSLFGLDLYLASSGFAPAAVLNAASFLAHTGSFRILADCLLIGVFGGIYVVPLFVLIQTRGDATRLSRTIACMNVLNAIFMVVAALLAMLLLQAGASIPQIFLVAAVLNAFMGIALCRALPELWPRFLAWLRTFVLRRPEDLA